MLRKSSADSVYQCEMGGVIMAKSRGVGLALNWYLAWIYYINFRDIGLSCSSMHK